MPTSKIVASLVLPEPASARDHSAADEQRHNESRFGRLFRLNPAGTALARLRDDVVIYINPAFERMSGLLAATAIGRRCAEIGFWADLDQRAALVQRLRGGTPVENVPTRFNRPDGGTGEATVSLQLVELNGEDYLLGMFNDLTERNTAQRTLAASEERFRQVVESISEVFWMADTTRDAVIYVSPRFETVWGIACEELYRSRDAWRHSIHPEDRERILQARGGLTVAATDLVYRIVRPDGTERWIRDRSFPVAGGKGRVAGVAEDITERKVLEQQFLRAQRLEAIGTLASGVAHDMNNILAPLLIIPRLLQERLPQPADRDLLQIIEQSARRGSSVVKQLLTFSRGVEGERRAVQLRHLVSEVLNLLRETFPRAITLDRRLAPDLAPVPGDPTQLHQVLMNLCINARDAMPAGGRLTIEACQRVVSAETARLHPGTAPGAFVVLSVADTGTGIPPQVIHRIFDPFFTTKAPGRGTGLGLSTVLGIVRSHGGFITVESEEGRGSVFRVHLPAGAELHDAAPPAPAAGVARGDQELILVVDDEALIRQSLRALLEKHNYRVVSAGDGHEALRVFQARSAEVALVLTDVMMPGASGVELARALRARAPLVPIIASTGLEEDNSRRELHELSGVEVLLKPAESGELLRAIERCLAPRRLAFS